MTNTDRNASFTLNWVLDAPPAEVFRAWTDPEHLGWFYNPDNPVPTEPIELDLRVGGVWRQLMVINRSTIYHTGGVYREIVPDEKLVFAWGATDGWPELDPERLDDSPQVTVTLAEVDGRTEMSVHVELPASMPDDGVPEWWSMIRGRQARHGRPARRRAGKHLHYGLSQRAGSIGPRGVTAVRSTRRDARGTVRMRDGPVRGPGRVPLRDELPLLELPRGHRVGVQALRGH